MFEQEREGHRREKEALWQQVEQLKLRLELLTAAFRNDGKGLVMPHNVTAMTVMV